MENSPSNRMAIRACRALGPYRHCLKPQRRRTLRPDLGANDARSGLDQEQAVYQKDRASVRQAVTAASLRHASREPDG
jgi:hypothetical protein